MTHDMVTATLQLRDREDRRRERLREQEADRAARRRDPDGNERRDSRWVAHLPGFYRVHDTACRWNFSAAVYAPYLHPWPAFCHCAGPADICAAIHRPQQYDRPEQRRRTSPADEDRHERRARELRSERDDYDRRRRDREADRRDERYDDR